MSHPGMNGPIASCPRCASTHTSWDPDKDTNLCLLCGWTDATETTSVTVTHRPTEIQVCIACIICGESTNVSALGTVAAVCDKCREAVLLVRNNPGIFTRRCGNCGHCDLIHYSNGDVLACSNPDICNPDYLWERKEDDYCSFWKPKEDK